MPCTDVVSFQFLIPLCIGWQVLFGIGAVHGFLRRDARHSSRGWQLFASVVVILGVLAIESLLQLLLAAVFHGDVTLVTNFFGYVRLLFCSLSDSLFIALLLAISGGYWYEDMFSSWACVLVIAQLVVFPTPIMYHSITRETLGPYKAKVVQWAMVAITAAVGEDPAAFDRALAPWQRFSLAMLVLLNLMALLLAWIYTFDFLAREVEDLELQAGQTSRALQMAELGSQGVPSNVDPEAPQEVRVAAEAGYASAPMGHGDAANPNAYANVDPTHEPATFAEKLALRDKITLMQRFRWAVVAYIIATLGVQLLPVFLLSPVYELLGTIIILGHSVVLMAFLAGLGYIFRLRPNSPYLMLDEDGMETEVHTGLGVLDDSPTPSRPRSPAVGGPTQQLDLFAPGTAPPKQPVVRVLDSAASVDKSPHNGGALGKQFSLADADDFEELGLSRDDSAPLMQQPGRVHMD